MEGKCEAARSDTNKARRLGLVFHEAPRLVQRPAGYRPSLSRRGNCVQVACAATGREAVRTVQIQPLEAKPFTLESVSRFSSASRARSGGALKLKQAFPCFRFFSSGETPLFSAGFM